MSERLVAAIRESCDIRIDASRLEPLGGGSINRAMRVASDSGPLFLKTNDVRRLEMFEAEAEGLAALAAAQAVRVPRVFGCGTAGDRCWLLLEYLELVRPDASCRERLGEGLAAMHRHLSDRYGWHRDNTIGATPQMNGWDHDWIRFLRDKRLGFQLDLAAEKGFAGDLREPGSRLLEKLPEFFSHYRPDPSLLHGDLWSGNFGAVGSAPVIFDPAVYYGDRESDLAMTELFGGFGREFHAAYRAAWPMDDGYAARRDLYQLYHVLNHLNLFGGGYLGQARQLLGRLMSA